MMNRLNELTAEAQAAIDGMVAAFNYEDTDEDKFFGEYDKYCEVHDELEHMYNETERACESVKAAHSRLAWYLDGYGMDAVVANLEVEANELQEAQDLIWAAIDKVDDMRYESGAQDALDWY